MMKILLGLITTSILGWYGYHHTTSLQDEIIQTPHILCTDRVIPIQLEYARDDHSRTQGLMHRTNLGSMSGMLFVRSGDDMRSFWMKNTVIPLDMIFITHDGTIAHIHSQAKPHDLTPISSQVPVSYVLETNGGWTQTHQVIVGCKMKNM